MLVLTRKAGERLVLRHADGTEIVVTVVEIDRNYRVRLGIDAPRDLVEVSRDEAPALRPPRREG